MGKSSRSVRMRLEPPGDELFVNNQMQSHLSSDSLFAYDTDNFQFPEIPSSPAQIECSSFKRLTSSLLIRRLSNRLAKNHEPKDIEVISFKRWSSHCQSPSPSSTTDTSFFSNTSSQNKNNNSTSSENASKSSTYIDNNEDISYSSRSNASPDSNNANLCHSIADLPKWKHLREDSLDKSGSTGSQTLYEPRGISVPETTEHSEPASINKTIHISDSSNSHLCFTSPCIQTSLCSSTSTCDSSPIFAWPSPNSGVTSPGNFKKMLRDRYLHSQTQNQYANQPGKSCEELVSQSQITDSHLVDFLLELATTSKMNGNEDKLQGQLVQLSPYFNPLSSSHVKNTEDSQLKQPNYSEDWKSQGIGMNDNQLNPDLITSLFHQKSANNPEIVMHLLQAYQSFMKREWIRSKKVDNLKAQSCQPMNLKSNDKDVCEEDIQKKHSCKPTGCARTMRSWSMSSTDHLHHDQPHSLSDSPKRRAFDSTVNDPSCIRSPISVVSLPQECSVVSPSGSDTCLPISWDRLHRLATHFYHENACPSVGRMRRSHVFGSTIPFLSPPNSAIDPLVRDYPRSAVSNCSEQVQSAHSSKGIPMQTFGALHPSVFVFPPPSPLHTSVPNASPCSSSLFTPLTSDMHLNSATSSSLSAASTAHSISSSVSSSLELNKLINKNSTCSSNNLVVDPSGILERSKHSLFQPISNQSGHQTPNNMTMFGSPTDLLPNLVPYSTSNMNPNQGTKPKRPRSKKHGDLSTVSTRKTTNKVGRSSNGTHVCGICSRQFSRSDMLVRHAHVHTGHRPFGCSVCGQSFSRSDHLSTHQRTHTGQRPYRCVLCSYSASRRDMITRHLRVHQRRGQFITSGDIESMMPLANPTPHKGKSKTMIVPSHPRHSTPSPLPSPNREQGTRRSHPS